MAEGCFGRGRIAGMGISITVRLFWGEGGGYSCLTVFHFPCAVDDTTRIGEVEVKILSRHVGIVQLNGSVHAIVLFA